MMDLKRNIKKTTFAFSLTVKNIVFERNNREDGEIRLLKIRRKGLIHFDQQHSLNFISKGRLYLFALHLGLFNKSTFAKRVNQMTDCIKCRRQSIVCQ